MYEHSRLVFRPPLLCGDVALVWGGEAVAQSPALYNGVNRFCVCSSGYSRSRRVSNLDFENADFRTAIRYNGTSEDTDMSPIANPMTSTTSA